MKVNTETGHVAFAQLSTFYAVFGGNFHRQFKCSKANCKRAIMVLKS